MKTEKEQEIIDKVYNKIAKAEADNYGWTQIDEALSLIDYMEDEDLYVESSILLDIHREGNPRCSVNHSETECLIPVMVESVSYILPKYKKNRVLTHKNRIILKYYIGLAQAGEILF